MQTITQETGASLMAQWLATGGAIDAPAREAPTGDDGLATQPRPTFFVNCADDGLAASPITGAYCTFGEPGLTATGPTLKTLGCADDGLTACEPSFSRMCFVDDGLEGGRHTAGSHCAIFCVGLKAGRPTDLGCFADDGLTAGGPTPRSFGCADDGLQATGPTQDWRRCR